MFIEHVRQILGKCAQFFFLVIVYCSPCIFVAIRPIYSPSSCRHAYCILLYRPYVYFLKTSNWIYQSYIYLYVGVCMIWSFKSALDLFSFSLMLSNCSFAISCSFGIIYRHIYIYMRIWSPIRNQRIGDIIQHMRTTYTYMHVCRHLVVVRNVPSIVVCILATPYSFALCIIN